MRIIKKQIYFLNTDMSCVLQDILWKNITIFNQPTSTSIIHLHNYYTFLNIYIY